MVFDRDGFEAFLKILSIKDVNKAIELFRLTGGAIVAGALDTKEAPGGIDLNAKNMALDISKDGKGFQMTVDPAIIEEFQKGNFTGVEGIILRIILVSSPLPILGL
ncbi:MAG: hypothetical protein HQL26_06965 [Candidatus Omnitrophica bacterium]|nr:hypothetical protein [Candidatus Omnitrophota bacterium]